MPDAAKTKRAKAPEPSDDVATDATRPAGQVPLDDDGADWHRRVIDRSLRSATKKSIDKGTSLVRAAATLLERSNGEGFTVQEVADEAGQSLRTLYQYFESKDDLLLAVFEESQKVYARMINDAIADIADPLDRLAGALIAAARLPEHVVGGIDIGLSRLRLKLREVEPTLVARSQAPVIKLFVQLHDAAVDAGEVPDRGTEQSVYLVTALASAFNTSRVLGNETGLRLPAPDQLVQFCLRGIGVDRDDAWYQSITEQVQLPTGVISQSKGTRRPRT